MEEVPEHSLLSVRHQRRAQEERQIDLGMSEHPPAGGPPQDGSPLSSVESVALLEAFDVELREHGCNSPADRTGNGPR
jgi:hypothetical protein